MTIHFEWNGTWDKVAYWAYGMWVFNVYDWSYLFAWYGLGWDKLSPLNTPPTNKLDVYLYNNPKDLGSGYFGPTQIYVNLAYFPVLDLTTHKWANDVLSWGNVLAHEASHVIYYANGGSQATNWLTESLAYYIGDSLWPWGKGDYDKGGWAPLYSASDIKTNYKDAVNAFGSGGLLTWSDCGKIYLNYSIGIGTDAQFDNTQWTFEACGYYLWKMTDTSGKSQGVYNIAYFMQGMKSGKSISDAFYGVWGKTLSINTNDITDKTDYYYYFYQYWWV
jgi:hypothetical protein